MQARPSAGPIPAVAQQVSKAVTRKTGQGAQHRMRALRRGHLQKFKFARHVATIAALRHFEFDFLIVGQTFQARPFDC